MGKETLIIFLGAWVALQPYLGLPLAWDNIFLAILGVAILGLGVLLRRDALMRRARTVPQSETFVENAPIELGTEVVEVPTSAHDEAVDDNVLG